MVPVLPAVRDIQHQPLSYGADLAGHLNGVAAEIRDQLPVLVMPVPVMVLVVAGLPVQMQIGLEEQVLQGQL
jgi:hypothetical protein